MSKKGFGSFITAVVIAGAAAAGVAYYLQNKNLKQEIDDKNSTRNTDDDFEDENPNTGKATGRKYVSLNKNKDQFLAAAKETLETAKGMAAPAAGILMETGKILGEKAAAAGNAIADKCTEIKDQYGEKLGDTINNVRYSTADKVYTVRDQAETIAADARESIRTRISDIRESISCSETDPEICACDPETVSPEIAPVSPVSPSSVQAPDSDIKAASEAKDPAPVTAADTPEAPEVKSSVPANAADISGAPEVKSPSPVPEIQKVISQAPSSPSAATFTIEE